MEPSDLVPSVGVAIKLASIAVHAEELLSPGGHPFDAEIVRSLLSDGELRAYLDVLAARALLPVKR